MPDPIFKVGDIVKLKSGGPEMTVTYTRVTNGYEDVHCCFFMVNDPKVHVPEKGLPAECLIKV